MTKEKETRRNPADYKNYPKSGQFRFHGAAKDYYLLWEDFLSRKTDQEPPEFWSYVEQWEKQFELFPRTKRLFRRFKPNSSGD
jgi:hypothetical protein